MKYILGLLILLIVVIISVTLGTQNPQSVEFNFLLARGTYPLPVLLATFFGSGLIIGWLISGLFYLRLRLRLANSQRKLKKTQKRVDTLQTDQEVSVATPALPNKE